MAPPIETFPVSELPERVMQLPDGRRRKGEAIDLKKCELLELVQYNCEVKGMKGHPQAVIQCMPVTKLFRRCAGGLMVETTAWEGEG